MFAQLLAVTRNAFVEAIRQPFYLVWLATVALLLVLNPYLSAYTFDDDNKLVTDMGLSMLLVGSLFMAAFTASGVIGREIEDRTVLTVVSKPLPRPVFVVGKFLGVAGAVALAWWDWAFLHLLSLRQGAFSTVNTPWDGPVLLLGSLAVLGAVAVAVGGNYFFGRHFGASLARGLAVGLPAAYVLCQPFDHDFSLQPPLTDVDGPQLLAVFFVLQAGLLLAAVAVALSTRLGQVPTLAILIVVFLLGLTSDFAFGRLAADRTVTVVDAAGEAVEREVRGEGWARAAYALVPNLQFHWLSDALTQGTAGGITARFVLLVTAYTLALVVGVLALAVALFQTRSAA